MGLDNIPFEAPCKRTGSAVMSGGKIDCAATIIAGRCPWKTQHDLAPDMGEPVFGFLGTYCWYRGKVATWYLEVLETAGYDVPSHGGGFYGIRSDETSEGTPDLPVEYCRDLASWMADHAEVFVALLRQDPETADEDSIREHLSGYRYAVWWLRFVADHAGGAIAWW